jgi:hypothetical protein
MPEADTAPLKNKTRVRVTDDLHGVPEGTAGTVRGVVGLAFPRHRVEFDTGHFVTSIARTNLVLEADWDDYQARKAEAAEAAAKEAAAPKAEAAPAADDGGGADPPANDRMAALLAKSKAAREKKAAAGG